MTSPGCRPISGCRTVLDFLDHHATFEVVGFLLLVGQFDHGNTQAIAAALGGGFRQGVQLFVFFRNGADGQLDIFALAVTNHFRGRPFAPAFNAPTRCGRSADMTIG